MSRKEIQELLEKARRSLAAAEILAQQGYSDFAVSRAYYAMFYTAQALLLTRNVRRTRHSGIIAAFNKLFVHTAMFRRSCSCGCEMLSKIAPMGITVSR